MSLADSMLTFYSAALGKTGALQDLEREYFLVAMGGTAATAKSYNDAARDFFGDANGSSPVGTLDDERFAYYAAQSALGSGKSLADHMYQTFVVNGGPATGYTGVVGDSVNTNTTAFGNYAAYEITPAEDVSVEAVEFDINSGITGTYDAGVASALGASQAAIVWMTNGKVSGVVAATGWTQKALPGSVTLLAGVTYFVVFRYAGGTSININGRDPTNRVAAPVGLVLGSGPYYNAAWNGPLANYGVNVRLVSL